jgi:ribose 5-phosphate isomerase B
MKIAIGADHRGKEVLKQLKTLLENQNWELVPVGETEARMSDYPDLAYPVASAVSRGEADRGILVCGSGIGMSMAANKIHGVRAALVHDELGAEISRRHNDANIVCLAAELVGMRNIERILETWLTTDFEGGRHARRIRKMEAVEQGRDPRDIQETEASVAESG